MRMLLWYLLYIEMYLPKSYTYIKFSIYTTQIFIDVYLSFCLNLAEHKKKYNVRYGRNCVQSLAAQQQRNEQKKTCEGFKMVFVKT